MPGGFDQEKTEQATPKRLEELREKGQVARSREIPSVAVLIASLIVFYFLGSTMGRQMMELMSWTFSNAGTLELGEATTYGLLLTFMRRGLLIVAPLLAALLAAGLVVNYLQVGFIFSTEAINPQFSRLNPVKGFARIFSKQSLVELVKSLIKLAIVGCVAYLTVKKEMPHLAPLMGSDVRSILTFMGGGCMKILLHTSWLLVAMALLDYVFQRWDFQQEARMTKQEVKDEFKQREGDPLIKARIRQVQREMARRRMMEAVPRADVVITNPVHLAVALEYNTGKMSAPRLTAKGSDLMAERIKEVARQHRVPLVENKPLAQALYKGVEIDQEIPAAFYKAVAEVLSYVYRLKNKRIS